MFIIIFHAPLGLSGDSLGVWVENRIVAVEQQTLLGIDLSLEALEKASAIFKKLPEYDRVINHNRILITEKKFNKNNICFWFGEEMKSDIFYLDPRCAW